MKSSKSVSLDLRYWQALEEIRKKRGLPSLSSALEEVLKEYFGERK
jgi:metal-responsive CopG/Arc/MetJ family transcriptional regulator